MNNPQRLENVEYMRVPPQNLEAEELVLSACLLGKAELVAELITVEDFYKVSHQKIFQAVKDLLVLKSPVELPTVVNQLRDNGTIEESGGALAISKLLDEISSTGNYETYCRIVKDKAVLREIITSAHRIAQVGYESSDASEALDTAQSAIMGIGYDTGVSCSTALSDCVMDVVKDLEKLGNKFQKISGVASGLSELDWATCGFQDTDLVIIAGRPSMGKTALAFNIAEGAADANVPVAFMSLEMSVKQLTTRAISGRSGVNSMKFRRGGLSATDWEKISKAAGQLWGKKIYIDDSAAITHQQLTRNIRQLKKKHDIGLAIIDYVQLVKCPGETRRDLEIGDISGALKALAKELNIPIIALSQLNRKLEERGDKRPLMSDLRESGALEQDADIVMLLYRDEVYNKAEDNPDRGKAELNIAKHRNGPTKIVKLAWQESTSRFRDLVPEGEYE